MSVKPRRRTPAPPGFLSYEDACAYVGVGRKKMIQLVKRRKVRIHRLGYRTAWFRKEDLDLFLSKTTNIAVTP